MGTMTVGAISVHSGGAREKLRLLARDSKSGFVSTADAVAALRTTPQLASLTLSRLARNGWLTRVRRGLYLLLPLEASVDGSAIEDPWLLARELFSPCYVGGWTAAEHWGLTEQVFRKTFVASAAAVRRTAVTVLGAEFRIARVAASRVEGVETIWRGAERVAVSSRARTIADALATPSWVGGVRHLVEIMAAYRASTDWSAERLLSEVTRLESGAAFKRLGFLTEAVLAADPRILREAERRRTAGLIRLDPSIPERGRANNRWGLWVNVDLSRDRSPA